MSRGALIADMQPFMGKQVIECFDKIEEIAKSRHYSVNISDPEFNTKAINRDERRLNVHTNSDSRIISFSVG